MKRIVQVLVVLPIILMLAPAASAQSIAGYTIRSKWSDPGQNIRKTFYISQQGKVYEYVGSGAAGDVYTLGKWISSKSASGKPMRERVTISGRTMFHEHVSARARWTTVYTVTGSTCDVKQTGPDADPVTVEFCNVTEGPPQDRR